MCIRDSLQAKRSRIHADVGTRFINDADHADRDAALDKMQLSAIPLLQDPPAGIFQRRHLTHLSLIHILHAKKLVDELSLLIVPKATLIRDGQEVQIPVEQVVQDDVMILDSGQQICCDSVIIEGESEVNESLLTGESDPINKGVGDHLLSGSSIISGKCFVRVEHVGAANYVSKVTAEVRSGSGLHSQLLDAMRKVTRRCV